MAIPVPLPVIADTFRTALGWRSPSTGQTAVNVIHLRSTAGAATSAEIMAVLDAHVTQAMWDMTGGDFAVEDVAITPLDGVSATSHFAPLTPSHWTGATGGQFLPACSGIMKLGTLLRGRANRGRMFMPPPAEAQVQNGAYVDGTPAVAQLAWEAFQAAIQIDGTTPTEHVVASYDRRHAGAGAHASFVAAYTGEIVLATQRRRQTRLR